MAFNYYSEMSEEKLQTAARNAKKYGDLDSYDAIMDELNSRGEQNED